VLGPVTLKKPYPAGQGGDAHTWLLALDTPVFEGYYNPWTDVPVKPSGLDAPTVILTGDRNVPDGIMLGVDLKIQVTDIRFGWPPPD
jgi:hypothetical protein